MTHKSRHSFLGSVWFIRLLFLVSDLPSSISNTFSWFVLLDKEPYLVNEQEIGKFSFRLNFFKNTKIRFMWAQITLENTGFNLP